MATITNFAPANGATMGTRQWKPVPTLVSVEIDFAEALRYKGSALAAADVIDAIHLPADCIVHYAGIQTIAVDDATTLTLDLGITGGDVDEWVDGYDQAAAAANAYATILLDDSGKQPLAAASTLAVLFATLTGTLTVGKIRVFACYTDIKGEKSPGLAAVGS